MKAKLVKTIIVFVCLAGMAGLSGCVSSGAVGETPAAPGLTQEEQDAQQAARIEQFNLQQRREEQEHIAQQKKAEEQRIADTRPVTERDFDISQNTSGGITITRYHGTPKIIAIPATISGLPVTEIANGRVRERWNMPEEFIGAFSEKN